MFMDKNDWSDDELEDVNDEMVVPISMVPTPQVISSGGGGSSFSQEFSEGKAMAYNEDGAGTQFHPDAPSRQRCGCPPLKKSPPPENCCSLCHGAALACSLGAAVADRRVPVVERVHITHAIVCAAPPAPPAARSSARLSLPHSLTDHARSLSQA